MRIFLQSLKHIRRTLWLSLCTMGVITLIVFFINILLILNHGVNGIVSGLADRLYLTTYLRHEYSIESPEVVDLQVKLSQRYPEEEDIVRYVSKEEGLRIQAQRSPDFVKILDGANPLPNALVFHLNTENFREVYEYIREYDSLFLLGQKDAPVANYQEQFEHISATIFFMKNFALFIFALVLLFAVAVLVILYITIGNYVYFFQEEIEITRSVGGSKKFLYGPFAMLGLIYTAVGVLVAIGTLYAVRFIPDIAHLSFQISDTVYSFSGYMSQSLPIFLIQLVVFVGLGSACGSLAAYQFISRQ